MVRLDRVAGQRALVLGAGVSGVAAARLLAARGCRATLLDAAPPEALRPAAARLNGCAVDVCGGATGLPPGDFGLCVASPAFAVHHPWLDAARARSIPIVSELELGFAAWPGRVLAVTGSKGKSSLVKLCADTLVRAGVRAEAAGNYGTPLCELSLDRPALAWAVTEVSSFQLELADAFRPDVAVLLNVQPDHLDRHGSLAVYRALKLRLFGRQSPGQVALLPEGFDAGMALPHGVAVQRFGDGPGADWRYAAGEIAGCWAGRPGRLDLRGSWFDNPVLGLAAAAGVAALTACGLPPEAIAEGLRHFEPLPHRLQWVGTYGGVRYVDDSKATSLAAVAAALRMVSGPVRLIVGGRLKEHALDGLKELLTTRVRKVYLIGESAAQMGTAWSSAVKCEPCGTVGVAVVRAVREAAAGETVILSPGCSSFDQFRDYKERGEVFTQAVRACFASGTPA